MTGMTPEKLAAIRHWAEIGYLPVIENLAKQLAPPLRWPRADSPDAVTGGTVCIVNTGKALIGVSAAHVHRAYENEWHQRTGVWCQLGGHTFDPIERLLSIDDALHIVTYSLSEIQLTAAGADTHHAPQWPPVIEQDDVFVVGGWPWALSKVGQDRITNNFLHFVCRLSSVSPNNLGIVTYTSTGTPWGRNALPPGTNLGGMSGGPVYRLSEAGLTHLMLVGTIYEYQPGFEIVLARPLTLVAPDGTIRREN